jgi:hypothetical protein
MNNRNSKSLDTIDPKYTDPKLWGPPFWHILRTIAHNYPLENPSLANRNNTKIFFHSLQNLLPCEKCRKHYADFIKKYPISDKLCCRKCLVSWVEMIYNDISKQK